MAHPSALEIRIARWAILTSAAIAALGLLRYGLSAQMYERLWQDLFERPGGPMSFRFILQPTMSAVAALNDGVEDAVRGRRGYLSRVLSGSESRRALLQEGLSSTARILLVGFGMDAVYQVTVLGSFYPAEMLIIVLALGFIPYLLLRGPFRHLARWWMNRRKPHAR